MFLTVGWLEHNFNQELLRFVASGVTAPMPVTTTLRGRDGCAIVVATYMAFLLACGPFMPLIG